MRLQDEGDWRTPEELYRIAAPRLRRLACLMLGSVELSDDVVHDAFAAYLKRGADVEQPEAYLRVCVVNAARSARRRGWRERAFRSAPEPVCGEPVVDEVWAVIQALPHRQRVVIVLRFYEDLSFEQIGEALGCPASTARSLARRALAAIARTIQTEENDV